MREVERERQRERERDRAGDVWVDYVERGISSFAYQSPLSELIMAHYHSGLCARCTDDFIFRMEQASAAAAALLSLDFPECVQEMP